MPREVEPQDVLLVREHFLRRPFGNADRRRRRRWRGRRRAAERVEERRLALVSIALASLAGLHRLVESGEQARSRGLERVEGAGLDETFENTSVHEAQVR